MVDYHALLSGKATSDTQQPTQTSNYSGIDYHGILSGKVKPIQSQPTTQPTTPKQNVLQKVGSTIQNFRQPSAPIQQSQQEINLAGVNPNIPATSGIKIQLDQQGNVVTPTAVEQQPIKPTDKIVPTGETISQAKPLTTWQKITQSFYNFLQDPKDVVAKDQNIYAMSKVIERKTGSKVPYKFVADNYDQLTADLGVRSMPTAGELAQDAMTVAVIAGLVTNPLATVKGIASFTALGAAKKKVVSTIKPEAVDFTDLLPENTPDPLIRTIKVAEFVGDLALLHKIGQKAPELKNLLTKDIITKYEAKPVVLSPEQVKDIYQTGKLTSAEEKILFGSVNTANITKQAIKEGITITPEQLVEMRDKPIWSKIKSVFGLKESDTQIISRNPASYTIGGKKTEIKAPVPAEPTKNIAKKAAEAPKVEPVKTEVPKVEAPKIEAPIEAKTKEIKVASKPTEEAPKLTQGLAPSKEVTTFVESYASGEDQIRKLQDIPVDWQDNPKQAKEIQDKINAIEEGNRHAVKELAKITETDIRSVTDALSIYIDAGARRGGRTLNDFYKYIEIPEKQVAIQEPTSLLDEAKKYKSAEEFVNSIDKQGDPNYYDSKAVQTKTGEPVIIKAFHGTDKKFDKFIIPDEGVRYTGDGVYFYPTKSSAEAYVDGKKGGRVVESYLDLKNPYNMYLPQGNIDWQPGNDLLRKIRSDGHDGIIVRIKDIDTETGKLEADLINEIVVFSPDQIKTKSQLTSLYNQAKGTELDTTTGLTPQQTEQNNLLSDVRVIKKDGKYKLFYREENAVLKEFSFDNFDEAYKKAELHNSSRNRLNESIKAQDEMIKKGTLFNRTKKVVEPKTPEVKEKKREIKTAPKPARATKTTFKLPTISDDKLKSILPKNNNSTLPTLNGGIVKNGKLIYTNLETFISRNTDRPNGWYQNVGKDLVKGSNDLYNEFPESPQMIDSVKNAEVLNSTLIEGISKVILSAEKSKGLRPALQTVRFEIKGGELRLVSTDGFRLSITTIPIKGMQDIDVQVPAENLTKTLSILGDKKASIETTNDYVKFSSDQGEVITTKAVGNYPDYTQIYPKANTSYEFNRKELSSILEELKPYAKANSNQVFINFKDKEIVFTANYPKESGVDQISKTLSLSATKRSINSPEKVARDGYLIMPINGLVEENRNNDIILNINYLSDILKSSSQDNMYYNYQSDLKLYPTIFTEELPPNEPVKASPQTGSPASVGDYSDIPNLTEQTDLKVIEMPEMVRLATDLMGNVPSIKTPRARKIGVPNGFFVPRMNGEIVLNPAIFKTPGQAAKTLAHEMGHLADYIPDHTMARGNVIGRIASLHKFLRQTFSGIETENKVDELIRQRDDLRSQRKELKDSEGNITDKALDTRILLELKKVNNDIKLSRENVEIIDKEVRKELEDLSLKWKPVTIEQFNPETLKLEKVVLTRKEAMAAMPDFMKYRLSTKEIYADSISVLFNDPALLKKDAPKFFDSLFKYMDRKPEFKKEFDDLQTILHAGDDEVMKLRLQELDNDYATGEKLFLAKEAEANNQKFNLMRKLDTLFINKSASLIRKAEGLMKKGAVIDPSINPIYTQGGLNYLEGSTKNFIADNYQPAVNAVESVLDGWNELGKILQLERAIYERGELANPRGYDPKTATETLDFMQSQHSPEDWKKLQEGKDIFRKATQELLNLAEKEEYYKPELIEQMKANPAYATFQVLDYLDTKISSKISHQVGTLKGISNPATASIMKAVTTHRAIMYNTAKRNNIEFMQEFFKEEIEPARTRFTGKGHEALPPKDKTKDLVLVVEKGKMKGYYLDKDVANVLNAVKEETLQALAKVSRVITQAPIFRPIFTSANLGFQIFNLKKDFDRTWRNMPDETLGQAIRSLPTLAKDYVSAVPSAWRSAIGKSDAIIKEMENKKILGLTRNDLYGDPDPSETQITRELRKIGALPEQEKKSLLVFKPFIKFFDGVQLLGDFIERVPKIAGYNRLKGTMVDEELANYVRNYIGSPDFRTGGSATPITNNIFMFSNAAKEGIIGDIKMSQRPKTKGAWWFKMLLLTIIPKMFQMAVKSGLFGDDKEKELSGVSEYDKTNYNIITFGLDENGKTIYLRIPTDESARFIGALTWKSLNIFDKENNQSLTKSLTDIFSIWSGQLPNLSPSWKVAGAVMNYLSGNNPYDSFRNRNVIPDQQFKAGFKYSLPIFLKWVSNELGLSVVLPSYTPDGQMTKLEKMVNLPVLSNILGRFLKVSDYGKVEKSKKIQSKVESEAAAKSLEKNKKIDDAVKNYISGDQSEQARSKASGDLIKAILGKVPSTKEEISQAKAIDKKFRIGSMIGAYGTEVDNVIESTTNEAKAQNLMILYEGTERDKFNSLMKVMRSEGVVTKDTETKFQQLLKDKEKPPKTGFSLVKKAMAAEETGSVKSEKSYRLSGVEKLYDSKKDVIDVINSAADKYGVPRDLAVDIAYSESMLDPTNSAKRGGYDGVTINKETGEPYPLSTSAGLFMFNNDTWDEAKRRGFISQNASKEDPKANAEAAMGFISKGLLSRWDASKNEGKSWGQNYTEEELAKYYGQQATVNEVKPIDKKPAQPEEKIKDEPMISHPMSGLKYPARYLRKDGRNPFIDSKPSILDYTKRTKNEKFYS